MVSANDISVSKKAKDLTPGYLTPFCALLAALKKSRYIEAVSVRGQLPAKPGSRHHDELARHAKNGEIDTGLFQLD